MKRLLLLGGTICLGLTQANAQTWRWGKRGGTSVTGSSLDREQIAGMGTDRAGNLYVVAHSFSGALPPKDSMAYDVDGHRQYSYGNQDILQLMDAKGNRGAACIIIRSAT